MRMVVKQLTAKLKKIMGKNLIKVTGFRFSDEKIPLKMDVIAKAHKRNRNQEVEWALSEYIKAYEKENGEIICKAKTE